MKIAMIFFALLVVSLSTAHAANDKFSCSGFFDSLRNCKPYKCKFNDKDFPDFVSEYEVKGPEKDGKCHYVEIFSYDSKKGVKGDYLECNFDERMRNAYANIMKNMMVDGIIDYNSDFEDFKATLKSGECALKKNRNKKKGVGTGKKA